jgi:glycosyltransferase involved in cell wall biosynthesis
MKILFIGQRGIPTLSRVALRERRVEALATSLAAAGHAVTVTCARPFISASLRRFNGVQLHHVPSFSPEVAGGWMYTLLEVFSLARSQSNAVHLHGWRMAFLLPLAALLRPEATFVWTIDELPQHFVPLAGMVARWAEAVCDATVVPTRQLQYRLLQTFGVHARYIPDGYAAYALPQIPASRFGLRKDQYCITTATAISDVRAVARGYAEAKTRKKLVVLAEKVGPWRRLARQYPFLSFVGTVGRWEELSLLGQAATVIVAGATTPHEIVLQVMNSKRAVVASALPQYEEVLGVTASFFRAGDTAGLAEALTEITSRHPKQAARGSRAQRRAAAHFSWSRITAEYLDLYSILTAHRVVIDSARPSFAQAQTAR